MDILLAIAVVIDENFLLIVGTVIGIIAGICTILEYIESKQKK